MAIIFNILTSTKKGGLEEAFVNYSQALKQQRHNIVPILNTDSKYKNKLPEAEFCNFFESKIGFLSALLNQKFLSLLKQHKPDIIIIHNSRLLPFLNTIKHKFDFKIIAVNHGYNPKRVLFADYIITVNKKLLAETIEHGFHKKHTKLLYNSVRLAESENKHSKGFAIGFIGRASHQKGLDILIKALPQNTKLYVAGDGELLEQNKKLAATLGKENQIEFLGWIDNKKSFFEKINLLCVPSRYEGFGMVILESFAHNIPVIASNVDGPSEIINNNENGILVEPENIQDLQDAIINLQQNPQKLSELSLNGIETLKNRFSFEFFANNLDKIIQEVKDI